jgi:hypothetical protein
MFYLKRFYLFLIGINLTAQLFDFCLKGGFKDSSSLICICLYTLDGFIETL